MIRKDIPTLLKKRRKELNLTLEEAGKRLGVSKTTYRDYENGVLLASNMKIEKIIPLAAFLDLLPNDLFLMEMEENMLNFNKYQYKEIMIRLLEVTVNDLTEEEKNYLKKSIELICK